MYFGAVAIVAGTEQRVRCRNPNLVRTVCGSMEDVCLLSRQLQTLAREFTEWKGRRGVRTGLGTSNKELSYLCYT